MSAPTESTFAADLQQAVEQSVLAMVRKGDWLSVDYGRRIQVTPEKLRELYEGIDLRRVVAKCAERVEERLADVLFNALATEIATDVKKILSNTELREAVRAIIREKIRGAAKALAAPNGGAA